MEAAAEEDRKVFVVVPAEPRAGRSTLSWALSHLCGGGAATVVVTHVHVPPQMIPVMGAKFHASKLSPEQVSSFRTMEREKAEKMLDDYVDQCSKLKVKCEKLVIEKEDVASGVIELIGLHGITELVVAAAADRQYSRKLDRPMCRTAAAIMQRADPSCKILFVCKEQLICTRDTEVETPSAPTAPLLLPNPDHEVLQVSTSQEEDDDDGGIDIELGFYDELSEARRAAEDLMNRALQESRRRQKADEEVASSLHKAEAHKGLYLQEVKKREELEAALVRAEREISELRQAIQRITAEEESQEREATATATATATRSMVLGQPGIVSVEPEAVLCHCQCQRKLAASSPSSVIPSCPHLDEEGFTTCEAGAAGCCCWLDGMSSPVGATGAAQPLPCPGYALRAVVQDYMRQQQQRCPFP
uniref:Uncharacterized protein n=1 Tax=Avena sativa TaxID=4498 RepID=A0ACD5U5C8_AVESA